MRPLAPCACMKQSSFPAAATNHVADSSVTKLLLHLRVSLLLSNTHVKDIFNEKEQRPELRVFSQF